MAQKEYDLSRYRLTQAEETLRSAVICFDNGLFKDSINRSYYVVFYAVKAVLALDSVDFKRHKDAVNYFNQYYIATEVFPKELGKRLGRSKRIREVSDYNDFYVASREEALEQIGTAKMTLALISEYLSKRYY
ncbi:HEPN domain-containing protein [bacterium D16-51]|nr:HEPN domain-containing protein [bacterium D16-59]RKI55167.1 HEPN domain-containing protein [bacterium D16-51]